MTPTKILLIILFLHTGTLSFSQLSIDSLLGKTDPQKWSASVEKKATKLQDKIVTKSQKTLSDLQRQEEKIYHRMLRGKDSLIAKAALSDIKDKYKPLLDKIKNPSVAGGAKSYIAKLDTISTALKFLDQNGATGKVKDALSKTQSLQDKFQQAEEIKKFIRERREQLKGQLEKLGLVKQLKKYNKEFFYYTEQIKSYRESLRDSKKAERKAIELLSKTQIFKDFMQKNSQLASLFRLPGSDPSSFGEAGGGLAGLQTRAQVNNLIQQQISSGGPNAMQQFQQNLNDAQSQLNKLKDKILNSPLGAGGFGGSSDDIMPEGFKPNGQKTKSFLKRLEFGTNTQTQKATSFFPVTSDIGLSLGYKLNDKSIIGVGASYKLGWGRGWNHIKFTSEGMGLRSYIDWKIPSPKGEAGGSFWLSGGYEQNYKTGFSDFDQLRDFSSWQQSGLLGLSKVISLKTKLFKKTKLQLLWDFLSYQQIPKTQPIIFRVGYNF